ncbi:hypothetical protein ABZU76_38275 [Amycolatopsis sp. NPDC005232]|uniref:hypothetical protein n=1 Tax=Amycolatopsis sp. NPDC005232 TaxID=3157027 RepID=UPI0033B2F67D
MPPDNHVTLGRSGLRVSPFALGATTFGEDPRAAGEGARALFASTWERVQATDELGAA